MAGILILIGLWTRPAALVASGEMAVAYFWVHQFHGIAIGQPVGPTPVQNGGQAAVLLCFGFLFLTAHGAGIWSVDAMRRAAGPTTGAVAASHRA